MLIPIGQNALYPISVLSLWGGTPSKSKPEYYAAQGIAWITPKDLSVDKSKFISHGENDISELGFSKSNAKKMPAGTILFSSRAPIGYIAIAQNEITTNQDLNLLFRMKISVQLTCISCWKIFFRQLKAWLQDQLLRKYLEQEWSLYLLLCLMSILSSFLVISANLYSKSKSFLKQRTNIFPHLEIPYYRSWCPASLMFPI